MMKGYKESSDEKATMDRSERVYFFASPLQALKNYGFIDSDGELKIFSEVETSTSERDRTCNHRSYTDTDNVNTEKRLSFDEFVEKCIDYTDERCAEENTENDNASSEPPFWDQVAVSSNRVKVLSSEPSGYLPQIANSKIMSRISSVCCCQIINSGLGSQIAEACAGTTIINSGLGTRIASVGDRTKIGNSGMAAHISAAGRGAKITNAGCATQIASTGGCTQVASVGEDVVICCTNKNCRAKATKGSWITLSEWKWSEEKNRDVPVCVKTEYVDGDRIKEDTYYTLKDGEFREVDA